MHLSVCMTPRCKYKPYNKRKNRSRVSIAWAMHENTGHDGVCACVVWISCHWQVKNHSYLMGCTCSTQKKPPKETIVCASMPQNRKHVVMVDTTGKKGYASLPTTWRGLQKRNSRVHSRLNSMERRASWVGQAALVGERENDA